MKKGCGVCAAWTGGASDHLDFYFTRIMNNENERDYGGISDKYMLTMKLDIKA